MEENKEFNSLIELRKNIPKSAYGLNATMYSIALEGWRRGLKLKFYTVLSTNNKLRIRYSLSYKDREHNFQYSLGDKISKDASRLTKDKELTKQHLSKFNIPIPKGRSFTAEHNAEEIVSYSKKIGFPLVAKPISSSLGNGVVTHIDDEEALRSALEYIRMDLGHENIIIEQCVEGEDTRVIVVGDKVVAAYKRVPANVIGDGKHSILELIHLKNKMKSKHPHVYKQKIKVTKDMKSYLYKKGYSLDTVPDKGKRVYLSDSTMHLLAAETVDITDQLSNKAKKIAINTVKSIPGMEHCGIDLMIDYEKNTIFVLEVNSRPNLGGNMFPLTGSGRNVPKAFIDLYFPETINQSHQNNNRFYFNFTKILNILKSGSVKEIVVPSIPKSEITYKKIIATGNIKWHKFKKWIRTNAVGRGLSGHVRNLKDNNVSIVVAGKETSIESLINLLKTYHSKNFIIENLDITDWDKSVKAGFRILKSNNL